MSHPHVLFEDALILIRALPPSSPDTVNENILYLLYLGLPTIIQQKMEANNYIRLVQSPSNPLALLTAFSDLQSACITASSDVCHLTPASPWPSASTSACPFASPLVSL